ncbi:glycosyltransferase family 2 protein [Salinicola sp. DM10]|uniref:glycosyltransferase family 2 protein n=1 Tax=Salinicola sp. DM10 TaxID=2815721 RepID=UPI001A8CB464|nr:glycosyltransferase family 2 protein [Salinicola sp. DM10]MCE3028894.1 glycosyltransferase family 2 protein [Salinicola sp. DM10]
MNKPRIRLCAVAKDEGPYLAEWVFHHLHVGFDQIHVLLNRTSDTSAAVLERIGQAYPQVTFEFIDWVDLCDPSVGRKLQTIAYAKALADARAAGVDWLMFLDIDEFWTAQDLTTRVDQLIARLCGDTPRPISFLWHCELGQAQAFCSLQNGAGYELSSHLKTLFPIQGIEIQHVRVHHPIFGRDVVPLDADGNPMVYSETQPELADSTAIAPRQAYVIHRMYRSEEEYLALLLRGRPSGKQQLKTNRPGYRSHRNVKVGRRMVWPGEVFAAYDSAKRDFMQRLEISALIERDRQAIRQRAARAVSMLLALVEQGDPDGATRFLRGTRHEAALAARLAAHGGTEELGRSAASG